MVCVACEVTVSTDLFITRGKTRPFVGCCEGYQKKQLHVRTSMGQLVTNFKAEIGTKALKSVSYFWDTYRLYLVT